MKELGNIYLSWRKGAGHRRHIVGVLKQNATKGARFAYIKHAVAEARKDGFAPYTEFPDVESEYDGNVLDVFGQRLIKTDRTDIKTFFDFWEIRPEYQDNKYYLLAHTQGLLPTDNFELLADYYPVKNLCFLTDLAGLTTHELPVGTVKAGDQLLFQCDPKNEYDKNAVKVFKDKMEIGYIKKIHSRVFYKKGGSRLKLMVKAVDQNGVIKRIFVKVFF
jgi:hypothetical protein